jgi:probable addiction module antidote protein
MSASKSFKPYRAADYLQTPEEAAEYLNAAIEDGHPAVLLKALRSVADSAGGMSHLSRTTGLTRESLYKALSKDGNPRLSSLDAILRAMGLQLNIQPLSPDKGHDQDRRTG